MACEVELRGRVPPPPCDFPVDGRIPQQNGVAHYSQWFPGKENSVVDSLSRDFHLSDVELVSHMSVNFANQLPQPFRLVRLTATMTSSVGKLLHLLPKTQQLPQEPVPSAAATGCGTRIPRHDRSPRRPVPQATRGARADRGAALFRRRPA